MATAEETYRLIIENEDEKQAFAEAAQTAEGLARFLSSHGCDATADEFIAYLQSQAAPEGEVVDDALEDVAGGWTGSRVTRSFQIKPGIPCMIGGF